MTNLQPIIDDLTSVRDRFAALKLDHPWDENIRRNTVARLDAALSDLRVVACRMREDQPRVTYDPATDQAVPVEDESLRAEVVSRTTTEDATVIDRADGTRTTVRLDGVVICEHTPITEDLMRRAQVGWVARTACGDVGKVSMSSDFSFLVEFPCRMFRGYLFNEQGKFFGPRDHDLISLSPPAVVANVAEVLL